MAQPLEFEFKVTGDRQAVAAVDRLDNKLGELSGSSSTATASMAGFATKLGAVGIAVGAAGVALNTVIGRVRQFAAEFEETQAVLSRFSGDIEEAAERTGGLISRFDLMLASNKAAAAGLQLSGRELANVAVRASEFARATGEDATGALDSLIQGLAQGEAGGLRRFGIALDGISDKSEVQRKAIERLEQGWGNANTAASGLAGGLRTLDNRLADVKLAFFEGLDASTAVDESFKRLSDEVVRLADALGIDLGEGFDLVKQAGIATTAVIATLIDRVTLLARAARSIASGDILEGLRALDRATSVRGVLDDFQRNLDRSFASADEPRARQAVSGLTGETGGKSGRAAALGALPDKEEGKLAEAKAALERETAERQRTLDQERTAAQDALNQAKLDEIALADKLASKTAKVIDLEEKRKELTEQQTKAIDKFGAVGAKAGDLIAQAIEGNAAEALDAFLKQTVKQNAIWALENTAKGIGAAIFAPAAAAQYFAAAAMHAGIAASAGVGAAIVPGGGSASAPALAAGGNRPVAEGGATGTTGGNTYVINVNGALGTRAEVGRQVHLALKEAEREGSIPRAA